MAVSLLYLAQVEHDSHNLDAAIEALRGALVLSPHHPELLALLGAYLAESGRPRDAVTLLDAHARDADADPQVVVAYALALAKAGRPDAAVTALSGARRRNPSSPALLVELGTVHLMAGRRRAARDAFEAALAIDAGAARAHSSLGALDAEDDRLPEAFAHWRAAIAADQRELDTVLALGTALWRAGRTTTARPYLEFFLSVAPQARYATARQMVEGWLRERH
jgi:tetratricopeptide (TPR) repeat protein